MTDPDKEKGAQQVEPDAPTDNPERNAGNASEDRLPRYPKGQEHDTTGD